MAVLFGWCLFSLFGLADDLLAQGVLTAFEAEIGNLVQTARPSVVTVLAQKEGAEGKGIFDFFSERTAAENELTVGSGLIISSDGFLLTKDSIIRNAGIIDVALGNNTSHRVEWLARDSTSGVALLKIPASNLQPARFSMSDALRAGSLVTVIGNALGVEHAVSIGFVGAIQPDGLLQISANVDPGSNGSPVFDAHAHAIGIVMGRVGFDAFGAGANSYFSNTALVHPFVDLLPFLRASIEQYYAQHGWIGITVIMDATSAGHPRILRLVENGPGHKSGLQVGDTITHFNGQKVDSPRTLGLYVNQVKPETTVPVKVRRLTQELTFEIRVAAKERVALHELHRTASAQPDDSREYSPQPWKLPPSLPQNRINQIEKQNSFKKN